MTEPSNPDNLESTRPPFDLRDILAGIRHNLASPDPWTWGNTTLNFPTRADDAAPTHDVDAGPEPEL